MSELANRLDSANRLGVDFHAARAFGRKRKDGSPEFENLDPAARRAAIEGATFRNKEAHLGEATQMRAAILRILNRLEGRRTPEQEQLLKLLSGQIEGARKVWEGKSGIDMTQAPAAAAMQTWINGLSEQKLDGILEYKEPKLVVVPPLLTTQLLEMLGGKNYWPDGWSKVQAPGWKFGVTDVVEDSEFDPTIFYVNPDAEEDERTKRTNEQMVLEHERRLQAKGQDLMPQYAYVPAAATVMAEGKVFDRANYTAFKREPGMSRVPHANFGIDRVELDGDYPEDSRKGLRCRPWVEGA